MGQAEGDVGVKGGAELAAFAEATVTGGDNAITTTREGVLRVLGPEATVDAAGVIGNFERMVRIADGSGIPLDKPVALVSADIREKIGIDEFASSRNTPPVRGVQRVIGRIMSKMLPLMFKLFGPEREKRDSSTN